MSGEGDLELSLDWGVLILQADEVTVTSSLKLKKLVMLLVGRVAQSV
jgi:hypothetical protein